MISYFVMRFTSYIYSCNPASQSTVCKSCTYVLCSEILKVGMAVELSDDSLQQNYWYGSNSATCGLLIQIYYYAYTIVYTNKFCP